MQTSVSGARCGRGQPGDGADVAEFFRHAKLLEGGEGIRVMRNWLERNLLAFSVTARDRVSLSS